MTDMLNKLTWEGNSKMMYKTILKHVPKILQGGIERLVENWVSNNNVKVVTEDIVFKVVKEVAPKQAKEKLIPELNKMRS
ncbi:hypothetical protein [Clostridium oceanicum]|uniref:Uncharacterized protein n=1 Tax=Clostridium oceanicum TaxID=1543 RepID=A0ABN1JD24_9CLOT